MSAQTVLEELARDELSVEHVRQRVDDWIKRVEALYSDVASWLPKGWTARRGVPVQMHEEPMRKVAVGERELPTLELVRDELVHATFRPYGLWIIGTNGRIDLASDRGRYVLLDHAGVFAPADWRVAPATARRSVKPFDCDWLRAMLAS